MNESTLEETKEKHMALIAIPPEQQETSSDHLFLSWVRNHPFAATFYFLVFILIVFVPPVGALTLGRLQRERTQSLLAPGFQSLSSRAPESSSISPMSVYQPH